MKALKTIFICAIVSFAASAFAEGGSDRLIDRIDSRLAGSISK